MPPIKVARFEIRPEARVAAETALHEVASRARNDRDVHWHAWREPGSARYLALGNAEGLEAAIAPYLAGGIAWSEYELVTSTDLGRRRR
jgi:hypothetical protein